MISQNILQHCIRPLLVLRFFVVALVMALLLPVSDVYAQTQPDPAIDAVNPSHRVSDSPSLRLPPDLLNVPPIEPPEQIEVEGMEDPNAQEIYDIDTGKSTIIPSEDSIQEDETGLDQSVPFPGLLPPGLYEESVFPPDDRSRVSPTTSYPWRTIVKLYSTFPNGAQGGCSGAIIGCPDGHGYHILTAGHCVHSQDDGGWASYVEVFPGLDADYMPYNHAWATTLRSYTGWTQNEDHRYDWAVITLDRNVGDYTGWMGRMTAGSSDPVYTGILNTAGYPCSSYSSNCTYPVTPANTMWWDSDSGCFANEYNHWYHMDTQPGQSGSPVWVYYTGPDERYILTVHAYGNDRSGCNHGTRLNQDKFDRVITWCGEDSPPTDYADLIDDGQTYSGFTPTTVIRGQTYFQVWNDVRNAGTASSGGFYVSYYASINTTITTSDYFICSDYVSSIPPFNWADSDCSVTFPSSVPAGLYYVGWIIDSGSNVTEFDEGNNIAYKDSYLLTVADPTSSSTSSTTTTIITTCIIGCDNEEYGQLNIVETSGTTGSQVPLTVEINNAPNMVDSLGFEVTYNDDNCLDYTGVFERGDLTSGFDFFDCTEPEPDVVRCGGFTSDPADAISPGASGSVVELTFNVDTPDLDDPGEAVRLDLQALVDDLFGWSTSPGYICGGCSCDVNGDGQCTPQDALCSFQVYLGICPTSCGPCEEICCDVNGDGQCTPADALCRFQEYLGIHPNCFD